MQEGKMEGRIKRQNKKIARSGRREVDSVPTVD